MHLHLSLATRCGCVWRAQGTGEAHVPPGARARRACLEFEQARAARRALALEPSCGGFCAGMRAEV